jgi:hypothetical protein
MSDKDPICKCHNTLGNDFWFLPMDSCLFFRKCPERSSFFKPPTASEMIELATLPIGELDPIRGGLLS